MKLKIGRCRTVHDVLCELMDVSYDIDVAARYLGRSDYCPRNDDCYGECSQCWKSWLESEVTTDDK